MIMSKMVASRQRSNVDITDKVEIDSAIDFGRYASIAFLVDKPEFILRVREARKRLGLKELLTREEVECWLHGDGDDETSVVRMSEDEKQRFHRNFMLENIVNNIKHEFHKSFQYTKIIRSVILTGKVSENDVEGTAFFEVCPFSDEFVEFKLFHEEPMIAIFVNPETDWKELKMLFTTQVKKKFDELKRTKDYPRKSENVKRDREWHWEKISGMSWNKIAKMCQDYSFADWKSTVSNAVKSYRKRLGWKNR